MEAAALLAAAGEAARELKSTMAGFFSFAPTYREAMKMASLQFLARGSYRHHQLSEYLEDLERAGQGCAPTLPHK